MENLIENGGFMEQKTEGVNMEGYEVPEGFRIDETGLYRLEKDEPLKVSSPLYVKAQTHDEHNNNWGKLLSYNDPKGWHVGGALIV